MNGEPQHAAFGAVFRRLLEHYGSTLSDLQRTLAAQHYEVSLNHLSDLLGSQRRPSPQLIDAIVKALGGHDRDRRQLHRAAAEDKGFAI